MFTTYYRHLGVLVELSVITNTMFTDPCKFNNGGCEKICKSDKNFDVTCSCPPEEKLQKDGKSCTDVNRKECNKTEIYDEKKKECIGNINYIIFVFV